MVQATRSARSIGLQAGLLSLFKPVPLLGYLIAFLVCVLWEKGVGAHFSAFLGLAKMPILFGLITLFKVIAGILNWVIRDVTFEPTQLLQIPRSLVYFIAIYLLPFTLTARFLAIPANLLVKKLQKRSMLLTAIFQLGLLYACCHI